MVLRSPRILAALLALVASACVLAGLAVFALVRNLRPEWTEAGLVALAVGVVTYVASSFLISRFVQQRVDLLHRMIHDTQKGEAISTAVLSSDPLGGVSGEVGQWAAAKRTEITELKERERFRREFIGNLAHELRTPIFSIQGYILTLQEGGLDDPKVNYDFLDRAGRGVDRLIRIVEDLDLISQLESGVMTMKESRIDLNEPVNESIAALEMRARERHITLRNKLDGEVFVPADHDRLAQVFSNLFINAVNYGTEGGWCEVRSFDAGDHVLVEVSDNGIGIAAEHLPRLFERFYRVGKSRARNEGGSGLGLAIVKHIVESHGGVINVRSREGEGTTFAFTLPKAR